VVGQDRADGQQYLNRKPLAQKPTAHLSYDQGLHLIRSFLEHASRHTVEELQAFTGQWVPHPQWVRVDRVEIPEEHLLRAADLLAEQLGPDGIRQVGGKAWWQWRKPKSPLAAEWIEMKADYQERKKNADAGNRVMLYVHGGAYYFGSVDEHRYQIQRHARKLKARAIAPRYRLAPQFPFPCGLQDCLATYLHLITHQKPNTVILAGDSAGGGMVLSMLVVLRDQGLPLPAGAVLISPWVDLTHSFPSVAGDCPLDYIPSSGFHHKPSAAWPPPHEEELWELENAATAHRKDAQTQWSEANGDGSTPGAEDRAESAYHLTFTANGEQVVVKDQIQVGC
jgi:acetyl esterase/lipase